MSDVFISWSKPDEAIVSTVVSRLKQTTYTLAEYSQDATAGSIADNVLRYVEDSRVALIFLSPASARAPWINTEVDWCYQAWRRNSEPVMIPIMLGDIREAELPHLLQKEPLRRRVQLRGGPLLETDLQRIEQTVAQTLAKPAATVIPIALLAMTRPEAQVFLNDDEKLKKFLPLCSAVGMNANPPLVGRTAVVVQQALKESLLNRYGEHAEDFSPFPGPPLKEIVGETVRLANEMRTGNRLNPLWLHWCTDELFNDDDKVSLPVTRRWSRGESILIVDSISSLHPDVSRKLTVLPPAQHLANSALLWIPPYTRHTAALTELVEGTLKQLVELRPTLTRFQAWGSNDPSDYTQEHYQPLIAFDIGTGPNFRRWLFAAFAGLSPNARPTPGSTDSLLQAHKTNMTVQAFNTIQSISAQK